MFKQICAGLMVLTVALLAFTPAASQDGRGVIIEPAPVEQPICTGLPCAPLSELLFPTLFAADPATGFLITAPPDSASLVLNPALEEGNIQTLKLRDDLTWSDGVPVTAYDVLFTYLWLVLDRDADASLFLRSGQISGARVIDEHTIAFRYVAADCASLPRSNFKIMPFHYFDPNFVQYVDAMNASSPAIPTLRSWVDAYPGIRSLTLSSSHAPLPTAGRYLRQAILPGEGTRLVAGNSAFIYATLPDGMTPIDYFLAGKANLLINPPLERRDDLRAVPGLQIADMPGAQWDAIVFNTADPRNPENAFDRQGKPIDQGHHPLFGDVRVRRAVQMAINIPEIIEAVYHGSATPVASSLPPTSWAFNADLTPITYDPIGAERLLESAGWKDWNGDGVRECHGCLYAAEGALLSFNLGVDSVQDLYQTAAMVVAQLGKVGFSVRTGNDSVIVRQVFDAQLTSAYTPDPDPDQSALFTAAGDVQASGQNAGSYHNDQIEDLMQQALHVAGCDPVKRADLYHQTQAILQDDQPYAWLYVHNDMYVAQGGIIGFAPYPDNPFWNIRDWVVTP